MRALKFHNQEFEKAVRLDLFIYDAPITGEDALTLDEIDCSDFMFDLSDAETLSAFKNLRWLELHIDFNDLSFLKELTELFDLTIHLHGVNLNVNNLVSLKKLESLLVYGETNQNLHIENFENVSKLPRLQTLILSAFKTVNLSQLEDCRNFSGISFDQIDTIESLESLKKMTAVKRLTFTNLALPDLDFLNYFGNDLHFTAHELNILKDFDPATLDRFEKINIKNLKIKGTTVIERKIKGITIDHSDTGIMELSGYYPKS